MDDDTPIPEDAEIYAAHPLETGRHDLYNEAMRLVGAKHTKGALVELVNWLLLRLDRSSTFRVAKPSPSEDAPTYGPLWRPELSQDEVYEALEALEASRAMCQGLGAAVALSVLGEDKLNPESVRDRLQAENKKLSALIQRLSTGWGPR